MQHLALEEVPEGKIYKTGSIAIATLFGGPFVGCYMLAENFKVFGRKTAAAVTWVLTVLIFISVQFLAYFSIFYQVPGIAFLAVYCILYFVAARFFQVKDINRHIDNGGDIHTNKRVLIITLIGIGIIIGLSMLLFFVQDMIIGRG